MTLNESLEKRLKQIGHLSLITNQLNEDNTSLDLRYKLYDNAVAVMANGDEAELRELETHFNSLPDRVCYKGIKQRTAKLAGDIGSEYSKNIDNIVEAVSKELNAHMRDFKGKGEKYKAVQAIAPYIMLLLPKQPEMDQETANRVYRQQRYEATGMTTWFSYGITGSIPEVKAIQLRNNVAKYVKESKNGNSASYRIDTAELKKLMENVEAGAKLYAAITAEGR